MALLRARSRSLWLRLHRWLGLGLGAVFVLLGLTGSLLVFYVGIDEAIEPALAVPGPAPAGAALARRAAGPAAGAPAARPRLAHRAAARRPRPGHRALPQAGRNGRRLLQAAAGDRQPATGQVLANRFWGDFAATWVSTCTTCCWPATPAAPWWACWAC
jgi:uncharacterized iron-regulated membrane protein